MTAPIPGLPNDDEERQLGARAPYRRGDPMTTRQPPVQTEIVDRDGRQVAQSFMSGQDEPEATPDADELRQPADATRVPSSFDRQPSEAEAEDRHALFETRPEHMLHKEGTKKVPRFKNRDEWRAHMHKLADDGKWTKRNWTK